jgi:hypothetical protein
VRAGRAGEPLRIFQHRVAVAILAGIGDLGIDIGPQHPNRLELVAADDPILDRLDPFRAVEAPAAGFADQGGRQRPGLESDLEDHPVIAVGPQHGGAARRLQKTLPVGSVGFRPLTFDQLREFRPDDGGDCRTVAILERLDQSRDRLLRGRKQALRVLAPSRRPAQHHRDNRDRPQPRHRARRTRPDHWCRFHRRRLRLPREACFFDPPSLLKARFFPPPLAA